MSKPVVEEGRREALEHLIPDEIDIYRILKSSGRSRLEMVKAIDEALAPLRAILALTPVEGVGEPVGWKHAIMCPIKKEKRWIYVLYPTEDDARRSGQRHDLNSGELLEDAADVRPLYATPVAAQGDEVRGALEPNLLAVMTVINDMRRAGQNKWADRVQDALEGPCA